MPAKKKPTPEYAPSVRSEIRTLEEREIVDRQNQIHDAAREALTTISNAAAAATNVVAVAAAEAVRVKALNDSTSSEDHDSLVELKVLVVGIKTDIKELSEGTAQRITLLENNKLDIKSSYVSLYKQTIDKLQEEQNSRLKDVENKINLWSGGLLALQFTIGLFLWFLGNK